ncbi:hypothetical protein [Thermus tenuipuniceus]|uniref:hypothetical protein n=1 Tax=Thermus tenuipuniceus TaxID=2078690 RepID=UPI000CF9685B|nr:hypothetical protein [Thermus tenuipuniceus]
MGKGSVYLVSGLLVLGLSLGSLLWFFLAPWDEVERGLKQAPLLFDAAVFGTPLGLVLLLLSFLGGGAIPIRPDSGEEATAMVAGSLLLGSKKDLIGF